MVIKTQVQAAKLIGVSQPRFSFVYKQGKLNSAVIPGPGTKVYWDSEKLKKAWDQTKDPMHDHLTDKRKTKTSKKKPDPIEKQAIIDKSGIDPDMSYNEARTLNEKYKAAMAEIAYQKETGKLISAEDVEKEAFNAGRKIRDSCLAIADRCAALVAAESDQFRCKQILLKEITFIMENLSEKVGME